MTLLCFFFITRWALVTYKLFCWLLNPSRLIISYQNLYISETRESGAHFGGYPSFIRQFLAFLGHFEDKNVPHGFALLNSLKFDFFQNEKSDNPVGLSECSPIYDWTSDLRIFPETNKTSKDMLQSSGTSQQSHLRIHYCREGLRSNRQWSRWRWLDFLEFRHFSNGAKKCQNGWKTLLGDIQGPFVLI